MQQLEEAVADYRLVLEALPRDRVPLDWARTEMNLGVALRALGDRETGGGLSLPVWIQYMQAALKNTPIAELSAPTGVVYEAGDWFFTEFSRTTGIIGLGMESKSGNSELPAADEKKKILDPGYVFSPEKIPLNRGG